MIWVGRIWKINSRKCNCSKSICICNFDKYFQISFYGTSVDLLSHQPSIWVRWMFFACHQMTSLWKFYTSAHSLMHPPIQQYPLPLNLERLWLLRDGMWFPRRCHKRPRSFYTVHLGGSHYGKQPLWKKSDHPDHQSGPWWLTPQACAPAPSFSLIQGFLC